MTHLRWVRAVIATALAVAAPLLVATPAGATTGAAFAVSLSTNAVAVSGADNAPVTLTAQIASDCATFSANAVFVTGSPLTTNFASYPLVLTAGTSTDGTWRLDFSVSAAWNGAWRLAAISRNVDAYCPLASGAGWDAPPADPAYALGVIGTNLPVFTYALTPDPVPYNVSTVTLRGRLALQDGTPIGGAQVSAAAEGEFCGGIAAGRQSVAVTDASGDVTVAVPTGVYVSCVTIVGWPASAETFFAYKEFTARRAVRLTATASVASVRLGRYVDVAGMLLYAFPCAHSGEAGLHLQRYAAGRWHNVPATLRCRVDPRTDYPALYRFRTRTRVLGNVRYRTYFPGGRSNGGLYAPGISQTLIVRVR